ncbi:MAG: hydrolase [Candidatus Saccharimonas sp.]
MENEVCCPKFDPGPWQEKDFEWKNKQFIRIKVFTIFYIPINFGGAMRKLDKLVRSAGATFEDNMALSDHTSKWSMYVYAAVDSGVPGAENVALSGRFISKVYEGDFKETSVWGEDAKRYAASKNLRVSKWYMWYTTCPKCAKKYGKNYTVFIGKVE